MMIHPITEMTTWKHWVTPRAAREKAVHRWYLFPHSFTGDLVHALIDEWRLGRHDRILDPFAGAGTTLLAAKERGIPGIGYDLSPLAVLVSNTKIATFRRDRLETTWQALKRSLEQNNSSVILRRTYPELVQKALPEGRLESFDTIATSIENMDCPLSEQKFFLLALISIIPYYSYAVANGGWLRWSNQGGKDGSITDSFKKQVEMMLSDVQNTEHRNGGSWEVQLADARALPTSDVEYSAVITSPPYPNRHDYTRIFGVELMFSFLTWKENRELRYQSFHSHPEAHPKRPVPRQKYEPPKSLEDEIKNLGDERIKRMLRGYFFDMYLCLCEVKRVCCDGAKIAFVIGNARYDGKAILVDELTAEIGECVDLVCKEIRAVRWRGNSAQQMGKYGRLASRESVVIFENK